MVPDNPGAGEQGCPSGAEFVVPTWATGARSVAQDDAPLTTLSSP